MPECPECKKPMTVKEWTQDLDIVICDPCGIKKYWHRLKGRFLADKEINKIKKDW